MHIKEFQQFISEAYDETDRRRGLSKNFMWFIEEVGELSTALASQDRDNQAEEFADCLAWLCTLANLSDIDLEKAIEKYTRREVKGFKPS